MFSEHALQMMRAQAVLKKAWAQYEKKRVKDSTQLELWTTWSNSPRSGARWSDAEIQFMQNQVKFQILSNIGPYPITAQFMCELAAIMGRTPTGINSWIIGHNNTDRKFAGLYSDHASFMQYDKKAK